MTTYLVIIFSLGPIGSKAIFMAGKEIRMLDETSVMKKNGGRAESKKAISCIVISAMMLALAVVLESVSKVIPLFEWPNGGSISITMVPLILVSLYCGPIYGTVIAICYSVINFFIDGVSGWTPNLTAVLLSLLLDYVIGFGCCGLAAIFRKKFFERKVWVLVASVILCGLVRLLSSFLSGMVVFTQAFDYESTSGLAIDFTKGGFIYSLSYNAGYMLPSMAFSIVIMLVLAKPLYTTFSYPFVKTLNPQRNLANADEAPAKKVSVQTLMPFYLAVEYILAVLAMIPQLKLYFLGYFGIVLGICLVVYQFCFLEFTNHKAEEHRLAFIYLALAIVGLALNIVGVVSYVTYAKNLYFPPKSE